VNYVSRGQRRRPAAARSVLRELVSPSPESSLQATVQELLDAGERKEWHLVGVAGGLPEGGVILFWDTARPSFGRTQFR
jgi:hypothetical protein